MSRMTQLIDLIDAIKSANALCNWEPALSSNEVS